MIFPKFSLLHGTAGSLSGRLSLRVDVSQRKVPIRQAHPAFVLGEQLLQGWRDRLAVRTLEIRKLHDDHRSLGISPQPGRIMADLDFRLLQEDGHRGLLPKTRVVVLARLLEFCLFQQLLELRPELIKGLSQLFFLHYVKSLQFGVRGLRDLGIHLLRENLFGRDALFPGLGFQQLLIHQILEGLAFHFVFLQPKLKHLRLNERQQIVVIDGLPRHHSQGLLLSGLAESLGCPHGTAEEQPNKKRQSEPAGGGGRISPPPQAGRPYGVVAQAPNGQITQWAVAVTGGSPSFGTGWPKASVAVAVTVSENSIRPARVARMFTPFGM